MFCLQTLLLLGADNRSLCNRHSLFYKHQVADDSVGNKDSFAGEPQVVVLQLQLAAPQIGGGHRVAIVGKRLAEAGLECRQVDALAGTQGGHDAFVVAGRRAQFLLLVAPFFSPIAEIYFSREATFHSLLRVSNEWADGPQPR